MMESVKKETLSIIPDITWHRVRTELRCLEARREVRETTETLIESIVKRARSIGGVPDNVSVVFHPRNSAFPKRIVQGTVISAELIVNGERDVARRLVDGLNGWLDRSAKDKAVACVFGLSRPPTIEKRTTADLLQEAPACSELSAIVFTSLIVSRSGERPGASQLKQMMLRRVKVVFGEDVAAALSSATESDSESCFLREGHFHHRSKSNDHLMSLRGYLGGIVLNHVSDDFRLLLALGSEFHIGAKTSFGLGRYECRSSFGLFDRDLVRISFLRSVVEKMMEKKEADAEVLVYLLEREAVEDVASRIVDGFIHKPFDSFFLASGEKKRLILRPDPEDMIIEKAAATLLEPVWELVASQCSFGYRKGRGRKDAKRQVKEYLHEGCGWVFESDIESFFDSLSWDIVFHIINRYIPADDTLTIRIIRETITAPRCSGSVIFERTEGIPTGSPLSPLIANLVLSGFDREMADRGHRLIRYADDFLVLCSSRDDAKRARGDAEAVLETIGLHLNPHKTTIRHIADGAIEFLGYTIPDSDEIPGSAAAMLEKTLYVQTEGSFVAVENDSVVVRKKDAVIGHVPFHRIRDIAIMGNAGVSTRLLQKCSEEAIPVTFCSHGGYVYNTLRPDSKAFFSRIHLHHRRFTSLTDDEKTSIASDLVQAELANYAAYLQTRYSAAIGESIRDLLHRAEKATNATTIDQLRGFEGSGGKTVFCALRQVIIDPAFHSDSRRRRQPDALNSLLNFGSYLLFSVCNAEVRNAGIDPYLGILHSHRDSYESLVCDVMEPFRFRVVKLIVKLVNTRSITPDDFYTTNYGFRLKSDSSRRFVLAFETEFARKLGGDLANGKVLIASQVESVRRWIERGTQIRWYRRETV